MTNMIAPKNQPTDIVILAAGRGKRMNSDLPKVLHPILGEPILFSLLRTVSRALPESRIGIVVSHKKELVEKAVSEFAKSNGMNVSFIDQGEPLGTGHAAMKAVESSLGQKAVKEGKNLMFIPGDTPLIPEDLFTSMTEPLSKGAVMRLLTTKIENPAGYGRVVRASGKVKAIVEEKDANATQKKIKEIALSTYTFNSSFLKEALPRLKNKNAQGEYYLTDVISIASKKKVDTLFWPDETDLQGVNTPGDLMEVQTKAKKIIVEHWASHGVEFLQPESVIVGPDVEIAKGVSIGPGVQLSGKTKIAKGAIIEGYVNLKSVKVGKRSHVKQGTYAENSEMGEECKVGPYAHLRPESKLGNDVKIGNFVELKKATIGDSTSVAHLSYVGDATVGKNVNIGCGFVTCNFDGRVVNGERKHKTVIEDNVFLGSDCQTVAPVKVGKGAYIASGSTITEDVPADSLAIARSRQVNKLGYAQKLRQK